jgi:hypothetical protein
MSRAPIFSQNEFFVSSIKALAMPEKTTDSPIDRICRNMPGDPAKKIPRDHLVELILRALEIKTNAVLVMGEPLSGKSTLAMDLYHKAPRSSIGVFLGTDSYSRSKEYIQLTIAEQISWIIDDEPFSSGTVGESDYRRLVFSLQKHSRRQKITWIIDGLTIAGADTRLLEEILSIFPLGFREFDFIFTAEDDITKQLGGCHRPPKLVELISVSPDEARAYLSDILKEDADIHEVRAMCCGVIGHMAMIRALLQEGVSIENLLSKQNNSVASLLEMEWKNISPSGDLARLIAYVVFSDRPASLQMLEKRLNLAKKDFEALLSVSRILDVLEDGHGQYVVVRSKSQQAIAKTKLAHHESRVRQEIIEELLDSVESTESVRYLPKNLASAGRHQQLVESLNCDHFVRLLQIEQTLKSLKQHAEFGREAARLMEDPHMEVAFCLLASIMTGLTLSVGRVEQIEALTRLGLYELALEIAVIAPTAEERLHLLARAINGLDAKDYPISEAIRTQVSTLAEEVGGEELGELGIDIACDLLAIDVKLAEAFLARVIDGASRKNTLANEAAHLQSEAKKLEQPTESRNHQLLGGKSGQVEIPPHKRQQFWREASRRVKKMRSESMLRKFSNEDAGFALLMCTTWLSGNKSSPDAAKVADAALDFMLANAERTPRLIDLIEIAKILPFLGDLERRETLCARLETQFRVLGHLGTTAESVRLRMQFYKSRHKSSSLEIEIALIDLFVEIQQLPDLSTKATCWAWMLYHLSLFEENFAMEERTEIAELTSQELQSTLNILLDSVADHFKVAESALNALSRFKPELALEVIEKLNTARARNNALETLVRSLLSRHSTHAASLTAAISKIDDKFLRSRVIVDSLLTIRRLKENGEDTTPLAPELLEIWRDVEIEIFRFQAILVVTAYRIEQREAEESRILAAEAEKIWLARPLDYVKIELGYLAARELADVDRVAAADWIERTDALLAETAIGSAAANEALHHAIGLATRILPVLINLNIEEEIATDLARIRRLIQSIPMPEYQVVLWGALVVRLHFAGNSEKAKLIADEHIQPVISGAVQADSCTRDVMTAHTSAAMYLVHAASALHRVDLMDSKNFQDSARDNIIRTILQRTPHWEPFSDDKEIEYLLDANAVADILSVLKGCKGDSLIFNIVCDFCRSLVAQKNRGRLQRNLVLDTLRGVEIFVKTALPDTRNIRHEGYVIACEAHIQSAKLKIQQATASESSKIWNDLYERARNIPNVSDRAIVTALVGVNARIGPSSDLKSWISDVRADLAIIPAAHDRIDRYKWVAKILQTRDRVAARALIADAMKMSNGLVSIADATKLQQQLLDLAHVIDPDLAESLLEGLDVDEARKIALKKRIEMNASKKTIAAKPDSTDINELEGEQVAEICYANLGSLLANRINPKPLTDFLDLAARARSMSVQDSAPMWDWMFENVAKRQQTGSKLIDQTPRKLFNAVCRAAEISQGLMGRLTGGGGIQTEVSRTDVFGIGDRDNFLERIREWAADQNGQSIIISDPYFSPTDIGFLQVLAETAPDATFRVLISREHMRKIKVDSAEDSFLDAWQEVSDVAPPKVRFAIVGYGYTGKHPVHDRWIVSESSGIRLGSSINSIGLTRISDLSQMTNVDARERRQFLEVYFDNPPRLFGEERLTCSYFDLR